jgi:hypothetical protein
MPKVSEFYGIIIKMFWKDHARPHFHAFYSGQKATYQIDPLGIISGEISERANRLIMQWARLHRDELLAEWDVLSRLLPGFKIEGLK